VNTAAESLLVATKQEIAARAALTLLALPLGADCEARRARGLDMLLATLGSGALGWTADERAAYLEAARPHMTAAEQVPVVTAVRLSARKAICTSMGAAGQFPC
jgi:hypothetical protein